MRRLVEFFAFLVVGALSGPLFEEPGWRGFALPRLQQLAGPLTGTLVLGAMWALWHLPQFLIPEWASENGGSDATTIVTFLLMVVAIAPLMTWIFNRTRGSLFLALIAHSSVNASLAVFVIAPDALWVGLLAFAVISIVLIVATRGRLGYVGPATLEPLRQA